MTITFGTLENQSVLRQALEDRAQLIDLVKQLLNVSSLDEDVIVRQQLRRVIALAEARQAVA